MKQNEKTFFDGLIALSLWTHWIQFSFVQRSHYIIHPEQSGFMVCSPTLKVPPERLSRKNQVNLSSFPTFLISPFTLKNLSKSIHWEKKNKKKNYFNGTLNYDLNPQEPENAELKLPKPSVIFSSNERPYVLA